MQLQQRRLVGVRREPAERMDRGAYRDLLAEDAHAARAVDQAPAERALRLENP